jgi:plastocyanin
MGQRIAGPSAYLGGGARLERTERDNGGWRRCFRWTPPWITVSRQMRLWTWLIALSVVLTVTPHADAQRVRGRLEGFRLLQNPVWREARDPKARGYSFREPVPTVRAEFRRLYPHIPKELCIAVLAATPQKAPAIPILVRVGGGRTTPVTIVVAPGTRLRFQNTDPFRHRLYAVGLKTFTASDTQRNATREWTVPEAGVFEIRDELAPSVRMWVVAEPNVVSIGYPSLRGDFSIPMETPGDYRVQAFFAGKPVGPELPVKFDGPDVDLTKTPIKVVDDRAAAKAAKDDAEGGAEAAKAAAEAPKP